MTQSNDRICPVELAGSLDSKIRRWFQNPRKILQPYLHEGMTVLEVGCGPGFFTVDAAMMVGETGKIIAVDLQEGMLERLRAKIKDTSLERRITLHKCEADRIGVSQNVDFVLLFYMVHEVPGKDGLFKEITSVLKPGGKVLLVEPPFHVSKSAFEATVGTAQSAGLRFVGRPKMGFDRAAVLEKS